MGTSQLVRTVEALQPMDGVFAAACNLAAEGTVASVHVIVNRRPTYDDLIRYRHLAAACDLSFMVTMSEGNMGLRLRRRNPRP